MLHWAAVGQCPVDPCRGQGLAHCHNRVPANHLPSWGSATCGKWALRQMFVDVSLVTCFSQCQLRSATGHCLGLLAELLFSSTAYCLARSPSEPLGCNLALLAAIG
jgi:hypothetical protein